MVRSIGYPDYIWKIEFKSPNPQVVAITWNSATSERKHNALLNFPLALAE